jgi:ubiquinol-cytochrome c reductase cytochrome b subunit
MSLEPWNQGVTASIVNLNGNSHVVSWGFIQITVANLIVIILMLVVFVAALLIPFRIHRGPARTTPGPGPARGTPPVTLEGDEAQWSAKVRSAVVEALPPDRLLPDRQPAYVASWIYVFGVLTVAALAVVLLSGALLALGGPSWWHESSVGLFANSLHLWSVEAFMFFMVIHLWGKFFMAAWRGRRRLTWMTGVAAFAISVGTAFTGYLSQQNFDSEWISTQAKDGINATGGGAFWNVLNFGQMLMWHILLLPLVLGAFVVLHLLLVRRRGVVPPFELEPGGGAGATDGETGPAAGQPVAEPVPASTAAHAASVESAGAPS